MHIRIGPELPIKVSPATKAGNVLFATNLSTDLETGAFVDGPIEVQALATFRNLIALVSQAGGSASDIAQITIYLVDIADFRGMNEAYNQVFQSAPFPTRATVVVKDLVGPPGIRIETTAHAVIGN